MTDQEIVKGLIERDEHLTKDFFFVKCKPLFLSIMNIVFDYDVEYDELVNELYIYLMEDEAIKLRNFEYRSSVYQWLKILATWKIQSELTPRANVSLTPENFLILTP